MQYLDEDVMCCFFFFKQKTAYEMRIIDWSSDVFSSDLFRPSSAPMLRETAMRRGTSTPRPITTHRGSRPDRSETKTNAALDRAPQCTDAERQQIFLTEIAVDVVPEEIPALERQRNPLHRRIVDRRVEAVGVVIIPGIVGILQIGRE